MLTSEPWPLALRAAARGGASPLMSEEEREGSRGGEGGVAVVVEGGEGGVADGAGVQIPKFQNCIPLPSSQF